MKTKKDGPTKLYYIIELRQNFLPASTHVKQKNQYKLSEPIEAIFAFIALQNWKSSFRI